MGPQITGEFPTEMCLQGDYGFYGFLKDSSLKDSFLKKSFLKDYVLKVPSEIFQLASKKKFVADDSF
jgi:hypothetical protein